MADQDDYPFLRDVRSPLTRLMLRPLDPRCRVVQFSSPLLDRDLRSLAELMRGYPNVPLRIYGHYGIPVDLEFLRFFPFLKEFEVSVWDLESIDGLRFLTPDLRYLGIGRSKTKYSLHFLRRFPNLMSLYIEGTNKGFESVGELRLLEDLTLRSVSLQNLDVLTSLDKLWSLRLKLGRLKDIAALPRIGNLKYLEIWQGRGVNDLSPVSDIATLQFLFLQSLRQVTQLPSFEKLSKLRRLDLTTMKGTADLSPIRTATRLEDLCIVDMTHLQPADFQCLVGHPTLKHLVAGLGSIRKNHAVAQMFNPSITVSDPMSEFVYV